MTVIILNKAISSINPMKVSDKFCMSFASLCNGFKGD